jgi:YVTN family beta-propeller protein
MNKTIWKKIQKEYAIIKILEISIMAFLMLMSISGAVPFAYITNAGSNTVSVIDTATNEVTATINLKTPHFPLEIAVIHSGTEVYLTNPIDNIVSVINTLTNSVIANVPVGAHPRGIAVTPDGKKGIYSEQRRQNCICD